MVGDILYTITMEMPKYNTTNPGFYYLFTKRGENYILKTEKVAEFNENRTMSLYFRPVRVDYSIGIVHPILEELGTFRSIPIFYNINQI